MDLSVPSHQPNSPHDEAPEVVNDALVGWLKTIGFKA